jgi:pyruvate dehydrogenase E1 component beta subunit
VHQGFLAEYGPNRVVDTPISEVGIIGLGIGSAMAGLRPICEMMRMDFALPAYDQIAQHAAKIRYMFGGQFKVPMVVRGPSGVGNQLSAQHSQAIEVLFTHCPGLKVVLPATPADAKGLLKSAVRDDNPVMFLEALKLYFEKAENLEKIQEGLSEVPEDPDYTVPLGKANVLREGRDVTIIAYSRMVIESLQSRQQTGPGRYLRGSHRPALPPAARTMATTLGVDQEDAPRGDRQEAVGTLRRGGGSVGADRRERAILLPGAPVQRVNRRVRADCRTASPLENLATPTEDDIVTAVKRDVRRKVVFVGG